MKSVCAPERGRWIATEKKMAKAKRDAEKESIPGQTTKKRAQTQESPEIDERIPQWAWLAGGGLAGLLFLGCAVGAAIWFTSTPAANVVDGKAGGGAAQAGAASGKFVTVDQLANAPA